jgi:hypothetical protein
MESKTETWLAWCRDDFIFVGKIQGEDGLIYCTECVDAKIVKMVTVNRQEE